MNKKLYVGGLSYKTEQQTLQDLFSQAGTVVSATIITDRMSGRSKGFGFVEMSTEEEAEKAISMFNDKELDGRNIKVNEARPQKPMSDRGGFNRGSRGFGGRGGNQENSW